MYEMLHACCFRRRLKFTVAEISATPTVEAQKHPLHPDPPLPGFGWTGSIRPQNADPGTTRSIPARSRGEFDVATNGLTLLGSDGS
jgi:hypothetical protein